jgi:hypothetical protein
MERYDWNTFSLIIDPRLPGKEELIDEFEEHGNEQRNWYFIQFILLLIYINNLFLVKKLHVIVFISKDKRSKYIIIHKIISSELKKKGNQLLVLFNRKYRFRLRQRTGQ